MREPCARRALVLVAFGATILAGCATPVRLGRQDLATGAIERTAPDDHAPLVWVAPVEDHRSTTCVGSLAAVTSEELTRWIDEELASLSSASFALTRETRAERAVTLSLHPRLLKAYVDGVEVSKTASIVIEVEFVSAIRPNQSRVFRGQHASLNWWGSRGELATALKEALASCLEQIKAEIEARLRGEPKV
jgi:hypothetical protein